MLEMLASVPKRTKQLLDRLPTNRVGYIDILQHFTSGRIANLDKLVTATNLLATAATATQILNQVDVKSSTLGTLANQNTLLARLPSSAPTAFGRIDAPISGISAIKKITYGTINVTDPPHGNSFNLEGTYTDITLPNVNTNKSIVFVMGFIATVNGVAADLNPQVRILSSTVLRISIQQNATRFYGTYVLVEFN